MALPTNDSIVLIPSVSLEVDVGVEFAGGLHGLVGDHVAHALIRLVGPLQRLPAVRVPKVVLVELRVQGVQGRKVHGVVRGLGEAWQLRQRRVVVRRVGDLDLFEFHFGVAVGPHVVVVHGDIAPLHDLHLQNVVTASQVVEVVEVVRVALISHSQPRLDHLALRIE